MSVYGNLIGFFAYIQLSKGNDKKAMVMFNAAKIKKMTNSRLTLAYANLLLKKGNYEDAQNNYSFIIINHNNDASILHMAKMSQALVYWKLGRIDDAVETAEEVYKKVRNTTIYQTYGFLLNAQSKNPLYALEINSKAYEYDNEDPIILDNLAECYFINKNIEEAKRYYLLALQHNENQVSTLYALAFIEFQEGNINDALKKLNKALNNGRFHSLSTVSKEDIVKLIDEISLSRNSNA